MIVFDRKSVRHHRDRMAENFQEHDFIFKLGAQRLGDRLRDIRREFSSVLDLGCHGGNDYNLKGSIVSCDLSQKMTAKAQGLRVVADEEYLPFAPAIFDAVISNLSLHWVNDLPGALVQIKNCLKPDGVFLGTLFGGQTLMELRQVLMETEIEMTGGASPRLSPFADMADMGALLQRAKFALPVVDSEIVRVSYSNAYALMQDIGRMGEGNAVAGRSRKTLPRDFFARAVARYHQKHSASDGRIDAVFEIIYVIGWAPHESQQKPLKPGSATARLADFVGATEVKV